MQTLESSIQDETKFIVTVNQELFLVFGPVSNEEGEGSPGYRYYFSPHYNLDSTHKFNSEETARTNLERSIDGYKHPDAEILEVLKNDGGEWMLKDDGR